MFIKLCVSIVIVLYLSNSFVHSQRVVWDNLIDLCYGPRPELRLANRCEGDENIKFERRLYRNSIPYYCLVINNKEGAYKSLVIEYNGEKEFRKQQIYFAKPVPTASLNEDSFELQKDMVKMVIYPLDNKHLLQRIIQIKLDNNTLCDPTRSIYFDPVYRDQLNINNARLLNSCFDIKSRAQRERNKCELLDEVIVEEMKFNNEIRYFCVVLDKSLRKNEYSSENELINIQLSTNNAQTLFSPKTNSKYNENVTNSFRYIFIREQMFIGLIPRNRNDNIGNITSIRVNGTESCSGFIVKPLKQCGQVKIQYHYLVSFGLPTYPGEFPWHVGLFEYDRISLKYICGGSIIGNKMILTAAHCLDRPQGAINEERLRIIAGRHDRSISDSNSQEFRAQRYVTHDNWNRAGRSDDIAVIILQTYVVYSDYIQPVCFTQDKRMFNDKEGSVVGWGFDENAVQSEVLKRAPMHIIPNTECRNSKHELFDSLINESTFCGGGYENGTSACEGDSGGGLVFNFNDGWYVRGIVSVSTVVTDKQQRKRCDSLQYVVFTDVSEYYNWIELQLAEENIK